jgi:hypothetical protein
MFDKQRGFLDSENKIYFTTLKDHKFNCYSCVLPSEELDAFIMIIRNGNNKQYYMFQKNNRHQDPLNSCGNKFNISKNKAKKFRVSKEKVRRLI